MNTAILEDDEENANFLGDTANAEQSGVHPVQRLKRGDPIGEKYVVTGTLGVGGFAVVYSAEHCTLGRPVAIKVMHVEAETPPGLVERFRQEARISALVHHPNVLDVYDTGTLDDGSPYLVMELIEGETLYRRMARRGLTIPAVVEVARQLLNALSVLAERGIVHRDIKPENVMLHSPCFGSTVVKVVDFGISKNVGQCELHLTKSGAMIGTPHYMSPEQIRGEHVDVRSDLYALGVVLYEALTGHVPYDGGSLNALVLAALSDDLVPLRQNRPECPRELERIVLKAMARDREQRYPSPAAMQAELELFAALTQLPRGDAAWEDQQWRPPQEPSQELASTRALGHASEEASAHPDLFSRPRGGRLDDAHHPFDDLPDIGVLAATGRSDHGGRGAGVRPGKVRVASLSLLLLLGALEPRSTLSSAVSSMAAVEDQAEKALAAVRGLNSEPAPRATRSAADSAASAPPAAPRIEVSRIEVSRIEHPGWIAAESNQVAPAAPERASAKLAGRSRSKRALGRASEDRREAKRQNPRSASSQSRLNEQRNLVREAFSAYLRGDLTEAHGMYRKAIKDAPSSAEAWRGLGLVSARLGRHDEARRALARYLSLAPEAVDAPAIAERRRVLRALE